MATALLAVKQIHPRHTIVEHDMRPGEWGNIRIETVKGGAHIYELVPIEVETLMSLQPKRIYRVNLGTKKAKLVAEALRGIVLPDDDAVIGSFPEAWANHKAMREWLEAHPLMAKWVIDPEGWDAGEDEKSPKEFSIQIYTDDFSIIGMRNFFNVSTGAPWYPKTIKKKNSATLVEFRDRLYKAGLDPFYEPNEYNLHWCHLRDKE